MTQRAIALALSSAALLAICLTPSPSEACKKQHQTPFELFELATSVAHIRVHSVPPPAKIKNRPGPGEVRLDVLELYKHPSASPAGAPVAGKPAAPAASPAQLVARLGNTSCDVPFAVGATAVIFLGADGWPEGAHEGYLHAAAWQPIIRAWAQAKDVPSRAAILVDALTSQEQDVRREAAYYLVDQPAILAALTADQRARLTAQLASRAEDPDATLAFVLVRLRERSAIAKLPRWLKLARAVAAVTRFESETDPAALARAITSARTAADRWAAFERCERARATSLARFSRYIHDLDKVKPAALAASCRDGSPLAR